MNKSNYEKKFQKLINTKAGINTSSSIFIFSFHDIGVGFLIFLFAGSMMAPIIFSSQIGSFIFGQKLYCSVSTFPTPRFPIIDCLNNVTGITDPVAGLILDSLTLLFPVGLVLLVGLFTKLRHKE